MRIAIRTPKIRMILSLVPLGPGSVSEFTMREILRRQGLDPLRDVTLLAIGEVTP
jgi:ABC-type nitrate/sulfonate/bicarbonate transport system substrate-binding protein